MRIRTVKPAFWANEKMAALPDFARLLALGLLNYADDHGYFWANPLMIRGQLFPFEEDASKIRRGLAQLDSEGFIRLGKSADGREVGHVVNFSKHQKVDRPQDSEIKAVAIFDEDSTIDRRSIDDNSSLDRKGKEGIGKEVYPPTSSVTAEEIYEAYPRKEARQDALKAISKAMKRCAPETLLAATKGYADAVARWIPDDRKYVPHPATWFNGGRYEDDPATWAREAPQPVLLLPDIYTEPAGWRERARAKWPDAVLPASWGELSSTIRNDLLNSR